MPMVNLFLRLASQHKLEMAGKDSGQLSLSGASWMRTVTVGLEHLLVLESTVEIQTHSPLDFRLDLESVRRTGRTWPHHSLVQTSRLPSLLELTSTGLEMLEASSQLFLDRQHHNLTFSTFSDPVVMVVMEGLEGLVVLVVRIPD